MQNRLRSTPGVNNSMSYQWGVSGPGFEYPTCYRTENRFLTLRAALLIVLALVVFWVALAEPDPATSSVAILTTPLQRGGSTPHVLVATLLLLLGAFDLWCAARQRRVFLQPGQPASLTSELVHQAKGASPGAAWLTQVLASGKVDPGELRGPYRGLLQSLTPRLAAAPVSVQAYLSERLAHLLFGIGLALALALTCLLIKSPPTLALACLLYAALAAALVAHSAWIAKAAPSPLAVVVALVLAATVGLLLGWFAGQLPHIGKLAQLGLPLATTVLLACLLAIEGLAFLAGRATPDLPLAGKPPLAEAQGDIGADPEHLMQEVERELHRYWSDGIPNRRHAWQTSLADADGQAQAGASRFVATVLEETQPMLPADLRDGIPGPVGARRVCLLLLQVLGLLLTLAGGVLFVRLADAHVQDLKAAWTSGASALVLVVAGGYAIRVGHLLWSRVEVESSLLSLGCKAESVQPSKLRLRWSVVRARSVFYLAGQTVAGSRTLLQLSADELAARRSVQQVQAYAERQTATEVARPPVSSFAPARPTVAPAEVRSPTRYCPACGTPVLPRARFCQHCGEQQQR